jgi:hypothetical protein
MEQKNAQCARLAECAKDYSLYDLFVYMHGDDIDFATGTVDKRIRGFDEINMRDKLQRIKGLSADLLDPTTVYEELECYKLLQQFHRFDEEIGAFGGIWQGGSVTSVCRGQGTSKILSLQSIAQIMISLYKKDDSRNFKTVAYDFADKMNGVESANLLELKIKAEDLLYLGIDYEFGQYGERTCPPDYWNIMTATECEDAAAAKLHHYIDITAMADQLPGCFEDFTGGIHYNPIGGIPSMTPSVSSEPSLSPTYSNSLTVVEFTRCLCSKKHGESATSKPNLLL